MSNTNDDYTACPNCNADLKGGLLSRNKLLERDEVRVVNEYRGKQAEAYCNSCGNDLLKESKRLLFSERGQLKNKLPSLISFVPVISTHTPLNWDYKILGMATGQSTTGTGVFSEFAASFTDLFGSQSGQFNKKLKSGENLCFAQIRKQALDMGGDAVIATDIDYAEVGGGRGMLMVCMAGTVVKLSNTDILGDYRSKKLKELIAANDRLKKLMTFGVSEY